MNEALEGRDYDVNSEVLSLNNVDLPDMLRDKAYDPKRFDEYFDQIDHINPAKLREFEEVTDIALAQSCGCFSIPAPKPRDGSASAHASLCGSLVRCRCPENGSSDRAKRRRVVVH